MGSDLGHDIQKGANQALIGAGIASIAASRSQRTIYKEYGHQPREATILGFVIAVGVSALLLGWMGGPESTSDGAGFMVIMSLLFWYPCKWLVMRSSNSSDQKRGATVVNPLGHWATYDECVNQANECARQAGLAADRLWIAGAVAVAGYGGYWLGSTWVVRQEMERRAYLWRDRALAIQAGQQAWVPDR